MPYGLSSCASNSSLRLSGLPSRRLYGCGVIAVSFIELDSVNVLGVAGGAVRRRKERDQEFVPGSSGRTDQYAGLEYASPPVPATSPSLVEAVRGSATPPGKGPTFRSEEVPDQRLPRGATHSCSAPPTAPTRSKSAS
jgi:hypothetical protein